MSEIKWKLPGPDEPGFLRRRQEIIALLDAKPTPEANDNILKFLRPYVEDPDTLLDCTRREYGRAILSLLGIDHKVSDPKEGSSGQP